ncbi:MAG TPA: lipocalin family protein [Steroidobacteraceae bacterium]|nr:lipocalin family protein [Steroidobacteraceae bacterium]
MMRNEASQSFTATFLRASALALMAMFACACQGSDLPPLQTVPAVDIPRFMGDWYVIACIPTRIERRAYRAVESYRLLPDGRIDTVFTFHEGAFDGPLKRYNPTGFVKPGSAGAVWGMQFIWPIKADYRVLYLDADYTQTVIGRQKRDYAWIMARSPTLAPGDYARLVGLLEAQRYRIDGLRRVPQQPEPDASTSR